MSNLINKPVCVLCSCLLPLFQVGQVEAAIVSVSSSAPPLGGISLEAQGLRETALSLPFQKSVFVAAEIGSVGTIEDSDLNYLGTRIVFTESLIEAGALQPDDATGELRYYAEFTSGAAEGQRLPIISSGSNWITLGAPPLGALKSYFGPRTTDPRDVIYVRPYWTLKDVEGALSANWIAYDSSELEASRNGDSIRLSSSEPSSNERVFKMFSGVHDYWAELTDSGSLVSVDAGVTALDLSAATVPLGDVWSVRRSDEEVYTFFILGDASALQDWTLALPDAGAYLELPFALARSEAVTLKESELTQLFNVANSSGTRRDELVVWEDAPGYYKRAEKRFYLTDATPEPIWRCVGDDLTDQGDFTLEPGKGYLIRRRR